MIAILAILCSLSISSLAQTRTTSVFLPIVNSQTLVASQVKQAKDVQTLLIKCPDGADSSICGFPTAVIVTAGPSTLALTTTVQNALTVDLRCKVEGSTKAECTQIYTGPASYMTSTATGDAGSKTTTWTTSATLESGKVTYIPVTITAGISSATKTGAAPAPTAFGGVLAAGLVANLAAYL